MPTRHRLLWAIVVAAMPLLVACSSGPTLHGWPITPTPAPDFTLASQAGPEVRLSDFRGDLAVVTFMYTNCTTACPLISLGMKMAQEQLTPDESRRVHFLAISVDPERDTPGTAIAFLKERPAPGGLLFLVGSRTELEPLWKAYKVEARQVMWTPTPPPMEGTPMPTAMPMGGMPMKGTPMPTAMPMGGEHAGHTGYIVEHTIMAYLIDKKGTMRSGYVIDSAFTPDDMVKDMRTLLALP